MLTKFLDLTGYVPRQTTSATAQFQLHLMNLSLPCEFDSCQCQDLEFFAVDRVAKAQVPELTAKCSRDWLTEHFAAIISTNPWWLTTIYLLCSPSRPTGKQKVVVSRSNY